MSIRLKRVSIELPRWSGALIAAITVASAAAPTSAATVSVNLDSVWTSPAETEEATTYTFTNTGPNGAMNQTVPSNSSSDLANGVAPVLLLGTAHSVSGPISKLTDGSGAANGGDTANNFFFDDATSEGRIRISIASVANITQINTFTWSSTSNPNSGLRAPQKYNVYAAGALTPTQLAADDTTMNIGANAIPADYTLIASVNTSLGNNSADRGQWGVSISPSSGASLGVFQNFVFQIFDADRSIASANEFYSEIDIVGAVPEPVSLALPALGAVALLRRRR